LIGTFMYRKIGNTMLMKGFNFFILLCMIVYVMAIEGQIAVTNSSELTLQATTIPELKLEYTERFKIPFLQGENVLTKDNNMTFALSGEVTPVCLNGLAEAIWAPISFFQLSLGGRAGSGWTLKLGTEKKYGIGINYADTNGMAKHDGSAFDGLLWETNGGAEIHFDLGAVIPGDWTHVLFSTYHEINYKGYTKAKKGESWYFEDDDGENCNGYNYYANFFLGYQMSTFVKMVALIVEADYYLSDRSDHKEWGDEKIRWTFSGIVAFGISEQLTLTTVAQFRTVVNYIDSAGSDWEDQYYRLRVIDSSKKQRIEFYRFAASLTHKF